MHKISRTQFSDPWTRQRSISSLVTTTTRLQQIVRKPYPQQTHPQGACPQAKRSGSVLILVLIAVAMLALGTSSYSLVMQNEQQAVHQANRQQQARHLAESGVAFLKAYLALEDDQLSQQGGLGNNPDSMQGVLAINDPLPTFRGLFTVVSPGMERGQYQGLQYGLENESAKLNINSLIDTQPKSTANKNSASSTMGTTPPTANTATTTADSNKNVPNNSNSTKVDARQRLLALPGMDAQLADAILDYLDADDVPREYGAEQDYYAQLDPPYQPVNGPLVQLEQLLEVRGVTPQLLYGRDTNQNYQIDLSEEGLSEHLHVADERADRGWSAYLTLTSGERTLQPDGEPRIDLNATNLQQLSTDLSKHLDQNKVNYILALRQYGPKNAGQTSTSPATSATGQNSKSQNANSRQPAINGSTPAAGQPINADQLTIDFNKKPTYLLTTLYDLVGVQVEIPGTSGNGAQPVETPWPDEQNTYQNQWLDLADRVQVGELSERLGRINVNLASRTVLETIEPFDEATIESILNQRKAILDYTTSPQRHPSWLLARGLVKLAEMKTIAAKITTRGDIFHGQVVGYFESGQPIARLEVILDRIDPQPKLVHWRNLSQLGPGFTPEMLGIETTEE